MTIAELFIAIGFKVDDSQLKALGKTLDDTTAKAKGLASAMQGVKMPGRSRGGQGTASGGAAGGTPGAGTPGTGGGSNVAPVAVGVAADSHVQLWKSEMAANKQDSREQRMRKNERKSVASQQLLWTRRLNESIIKVAGVMLAVDGAILAIVNTARNDATSLTQFGTTTGLDVNRLQQFQSAGSKRDVKPEEMAQFLATLVQSNYKTLLGQGNPNAYGRLGITPNMSPFDQLLALAKPDSQYHRLPAGAQSTWLGALGLGGAQDFLNRPGNFAADVNSAGRAQVLGAGDRSSLMQLDRQWQALMFDLKKLVDRIGALIAPAAGGVANFVDQAINGKTPDALSEIGKLINANGREDMGTQFKEILRFFHGVFGGQIYAPLPPDARLGVPASGTGTQTVNHSVTVSMNITGANDPRAVADAVAAKLGNAVRIATAQIPQYSPA